jgi:hypothetical protein
VACLIIRWLIIKALTETAERAASATDVSATSGQTLIVAERKAQRAQTLGTLFKNVNTILMLMLGIMVLLVLSELGFNLAPLSTDAGI